MLYDSKDNAVRAQRSKEESHDYRYFPEPDLPAGKRERFVAQYALSREHAAVLTASRAVADYYESVVHAGAEPRAAANWVMTEVLADANDHQEQMRVSPAALSQLVALVKGG